MLNFSSFYLLVFVHCTLSRIVVSAPYLATRNITSSQIDMLNHISSPITLHPLNFTYQAEGSGIKYRVPNTLTTLYFHLGFPCDESGIRNTIIGVRDYCEEQLEQGGDDPLPRSEDPFQEDLGYGAAIDVVSARPDHHLTWGILKDAMDGLWEFLVLNHRFQESEFQIYHGALSLVGRGTLQEAPVTGLEREAQKKRKGDSVSA